MSLDKLMEELWISAKRGYFIHFNIDTVIRIDSPKGRIYKIAPIGIFDADNFDNNTCDGWIFQDYRKQIMISP